MIMKFALTTVAAAALCVPAIAPAAAAAPSQAAVANVAYSVPASFGDLVLPSKKHHNKNCNSLLANVCNNSVQVPIQACGNNVANNIGLGLLGGKGSAKGGNNNRKCRQHTSSKH